MPYVLLCSQKYESCRIDQHWLAVLVGRNQVIDKQHLCQLIE